MRAIAVTTNPGLEDLAFDELVERAVAAGIPRAGIRRRDPGMQGHVEVACDTTADALEHAAMGMRSIHHVARPLMHIQLADPPALESIVRAFRDVPLPDLGAGRSFRVSCNRHGSHPFTSEDVERATGAVIVERTGAPVRLEDYELEVAVDIVNQACAVGIRLTRTALSRRFARHFNSPAAVRANVAYALLRLGTASRQPARIADPFCGSGTVLMEAAAVFPAASVWGGDWAHRAVQGASANLEAEGLLGRCGVTQADARQLQDVLEPGSIDLIATNPPYGRRFGRGISFAPFYAAFLEAAHTVLAPQGRMSLLVDKRGAFNKAVQHSGAFAIRHVAIIRAGTLYPAIFVLEPR